MVRYLARLSLHFVKDRITRDSRVILCEAPQSVAFHSDNNPHTVDTQPIVTPRRLPGKLSPPPLDRLIKKEDAKKSTVWTRSTPRPSPWPFDCVLHQINSNAPVEDRGVITLIDVKKHFADEGPRERSRWLMAAVIDGHSGWQTAEYVSRTLANRVQKAVNDHPGPLTAEALSELFCSCFERLDEEIRVRIEPAFNLGHSGVAKAGATTCATFVTPQKIIAANVGDSRAYLSRGGRMISLTNQHNAGDEREAAKLRDAHPNEEDLIYEKKKKEKEEIDKEDTPPKPVDYFTQLRSLIAWPKMAETPRPPACYTKGRLQLTRAFGDFYLKEAKYAVDWDGGRLLVNLPHSFPYVTRLPEVTVLDRDPSRDEFLVVASDGVWDELSPEEVGSMVRAELKKRKSMAQITSRLHMAVLEKAAKRAEKTVEELMELQPRQRREHYDDMTIAVVNLRHEYNE